MTPIEIKDASGKKAGDAELSASVFGIEPNVPVMHQVCLLYTSYGETLQSRAGGPRVYRADR